MNSESQVWIPSPWPGGAYQPLESGSVGSFGQAPFIEGTWLPPSPPASSIETVVVPSPETPASAEIVFATPTAANPAVAIILSDPLSSADRPDVVSDPVLAGREAKMLVAPAAAALQPAAHVKLDTARAASRSLALPAFALTGAVLGAGVWVLTKIDSAPMWPEIVLALGVAGCVAGIIRASRD